MLAGRGLKDLAIAGELGLSYKTVTHYLADARKRYRVPNREQLIIRAVVDGALHPARHRSMRKYSRIERIPPACSLRMHTHPAGEGA
ncbi:LuxR C-terminal-related transcriptional regulator [Sphingomonas sp. CL5.1]|uniref:LuxR C-terminal-related transcriptional regulator n=1 Tax=Sphingomonas sp. CL5.1 TaxID=2653203 RepID=UPI0034A0CC63